MVSWSNLEKLCSCSRTWMVSALACGNKWIQGGTYNSTHELAKLSSLFSAFRKCLKLQNWYHNGFILPRPIEH